MKLFPTTLRRGAIGTLGACAVAVALAGAGILPAAGAAPCKASGYASTSSGVLSACL